MKDRVIFRKFHFVTQTYSGSLAFRAFILSRLIATVTPFVSREKRRQ